MALSRLFATTTAVFCLGLAACSPGVEADSATAAPTQTSSSTAISTEPPAGSGAITISPDADRQATPGAADLFTGSVTVTPLFAPTESSTAGAGEVTFEPGARTAWHTHPAGQRLIITDGRGWIQEWGQERRDMQPGDVVWIAPGVKHWHGATATDAMTHIAVQDTVDGRNVDWLEKVDDS